MSIYNIINYNIFYLYYIANKHQDNTSTTACRQKLLKEIQQTISTQTETETKTKRDTDKDKERQRETETETETERGR